MRHRVQQRVEILEDEDEPVAPAAVAATVAPSATPPSSAEVEAAAMRCRVCGTQEGVQRCGRCRSVFYCGVAHQALDWPVHRKACQAALASAAGRPVPSLAHELLRTMTHTVEVHLLLPRENALLSVHTPVNDGVVFTVDDLIGRLVRAASEGRDEPLDPAGPWRLFRRHQEAPLDRDDVLLLLGLANFEVLTLRLDDGPYVLRLRAGGVKEMAGPDPSQLLLMEGIPETALLGDVLLFFKKKFNTPKLVLLKKPGRASCIKNPKKQMWQFRHYEYLLAEYASPETFEWRLTLWDRVLIFGYRNWGWIKLLLMLLLLALMALCVYILVTNLPREPELIA